MIVQEIFDLWGGQAEVCAEVDAIEAARREVNSVIDDVDLACSTFREDSEISRVNESAGQWVEVSPLFQQILTVTLDLAALTGGALDPTVGSRTINRITIHQPNYREVELASGRVRIPDYVRLDLGATAKAWCADEAARRAYHATGAGVLVGLCGDIAVAGPAPEGGWDIICVDDHREAVTDAPGAAVSIHSGGLATSSTTVRRHAGGSHILDPSTMRPVAGPWRTVSVAATSCVRANAASTAALVRGRNAHMWLTQRRMHARLVRCDGEVTTTGGWPR